MSWTVRLFSLQIDWLNLKIFILNFPLISTRRFHLLPLLPLVRILMDNIVMLKCLYWIMSFSYKLKYRLFGYSNTSIITHPNTCKLVDQSMRLALVCHCVQMITRNNRFVTILLICLLMKWSPCLWAEFLTG